MECLAYLYISVIISHGLGISAMKIDILQFINTQESATVSNASFSEEKNVFSKVACAVICSKIELCCSATFYYDIRVCKLFSVCQPTITTYLGSTVLLENTTGKTK